MIDPLRIKALYEEGYGTPLIAKKLGRSRRTVRDHLTRMQLPMRSAAEGQAVYLARLVLLTEEERKIAHRTQDLEAKHRRRKLGKGLNKWERKLMLSLQRRMK